MNIYLIAAIANNRAIGWQGNLLYHIREDMQRFKRLTTGHTIIMGRKTFESLPKGALPNRRNIVLTRSNQHFDGCDTYHSLEEALSHCSDQEEVYIIGGESIYSETLPLASRLYLTFVDDTPAEADAFFPEYTEDWQVVEQEAFERDEKHPHPYVFATLERKG